MFVGASRVVFKISVSSGDKGYREFPVRAEGYVPPIFHHRSRRAPFSHPSMEAVLHTPVSTSHCPIDKAWKKNDVVRK